MIICYGEVKMMDDFIRPPKKEVKQETKQRPIKEVLIVILIIVCLAIGYFAGYFSKKKKTCISTNYRRICKSYGGDDQI